TMYRTGEGVDVDMEKALAAYRTGCIERPFACLQIGEIYRTGESGVEVDLDAARSAYEHAQKLGDGRGTLVLGFMDEAAGEHDAAIAKYREGCDGGHPGSCARLGAMILDGLAEGTQEEARNYAQKACDAGDGFGCSLLGMATEAG